LLLSFPSSWQWESGSKISIDFLSLPGLRELELKQLRGRKYLDALCVYFWATTPVVMSIFTFATYVLLGNKLTAATVCGLTYSVWPVKCQDSAAAQALFNLNSHCTAVFSPSDSEDVPLMDSVVLAVCSW
jgi:hypothetical protein